MKKVLVFLTSIIMILAVTKVNAASPIVEITYSEWSTDYPSGLPEVFLESETRYHFYRVVNDQVEYDNGYYTDLPGYVRDDNSARTFYRYITNQKLLFNAYNELVTNTAYCQKSFCYVVDRPEPMMLNTDGKVNEEYDPEEAPIISVSAVPYTLDNITSYLIILSSSVLLLLVAFIIKRRKENQLLKA